jgi:hypothetical protein
VTDLLLAVLALCVGATLAWRADAGARWLVFGSALLVSGLLFMPGEQITGLVGKDGIRWMRGMADMTPWDISDWTHFLIFVWLGLLVWLARADLRGWKGWGVIAGLAIAAEFAQILAPERSPEMDDVLLNLTGGMVGVLLGIGLRLVVRAAKD